MGDLHRSQATFLNQIAWSQRWRSRKESVRAARMVLELTPGNAGPSRRMRGLALRTLAWQSKWRGDLGLAERKCEMVLELLDGTDALAAMADVDAILGVVHYSHDRLDLARQAVERGYTRLALEWSEDTYIDLLVTETTILRYMGRIEEARATLGKALEAARAEERARVQHNLARLHLSANEPREALAMALGSVASARRWRNRIVLPYALEVLGAVHHRAGRSDRARDWLTAGLQHAREDGDLRAECQILQLLGGVALAGGQVEEAIEVLEFGRSLAQKMDYVLWQKNFCKELAQAYEAAGDLRNALEAMRMLDVLRDGQIV